MERIRERPALPSSGVLRQTCLRLHVRPAFEHYTLAEVTTGRVEWILARQAKVSPSQAKQARTMLNMLFGLEEGAREARSAQVR